MKMKISVVIPSKNEREAIARSIEGCFSQTRRPDEVLVVDDSTDNTPDIVRSLMKKYKKLQLVPGQHRGVSAARNLGAHEAKGDLLILLDADIILGSDVLEETAKLFEREKDLNYACFGYTPTPPKTFLEKCSIVRLAHLERHEETAERMRTPQVARRKAFLAIGGFNESLKYFEDRDLYNRIIARGERVDVASMNTQHMEPATMGEVVKHANWLGASATPTTVLWRVRAVFYPLGPVYWLFFLLAIALSFFYQPAIYFVAAFLLFTFFEFLRCVRMTGMVLPSLGYIGLSLIKQFLLAYALLRSVPARIMSKGRDKLT